MAEICYSRGRKIIIHTEQNRHGVWISRFTIPGLWEATPRKSGNQPLDTYKSEWDAKTVAFEAAKRVLDSVMTDANDRIPGGHHGPHFAEKTTSATDSLCQVVDASGTTQYGYDAFGNITQQRKTELGVTYTTSYIYDAGSRPTSVTYPDSRTVTYTRDAGGRISGVTATVNGSNQTIVSGRSYRADG